MCIYLWRASHNSRLISPEMQAFMRASAIKMAAVVERRNSQLSRALARKNTPALQARVPSITTFQTSQLIIGLNDRTR